MGLSGESCHSDDTMPHRPLLSHGNESLVVLRLVASRAAQIPLRVGSSWVVVWREWMPPAFNGTAEPGAAADAVDNRRAAELSRWTNELAGRATDTFPGTFQLRLDMLQGDGNGSKRRSLKDAETFFWSVHMIVSHLSVKNWRNFQHIDVDLRERQFIVGANASGKSNLLDVFRFLRDIAKPEGGGLQKAVKDRGGLSKIRSLAARRDPEIAIEVTLADGAGEPPIWRYALGLRQETRGYRQPYLTHERVWQGKKQILDRPKKEDKEDRDRLTQTFLEQINVNVEFREIVRFFQAVTYLHLVPQLLRFADSIQGRLLEDDPFGQGFLERVAKANEKTRRSRLSMVQKALKIAVPQLEQLEFTRDAVTGRPHLQALYSHWRPNAGWQREDQFSDGTLRLLGLLWSLLESDSLLLLEEPELSLNAGIVSQLAPFSSSMQRNRRRQVLVSTHSDALLTERGIDGREVLLLTPTKEGTEVKVAADIEEVRILLESGFTVGEVVLPRTKPSDAEQLSLLK